MDLKFLGTGSFNNEKLGNTSSYFKSENGKSLVLIDCGSTVFDKMIKENILNDIDVVYAVITHTHPDHIGSLGSLIFHMNYVLKKAIYVLFPDSSIKLMLNSMGVKEDLYNFYQLIPYTQTALSDKNFKEEVKITPLYSKHVSEINSFGYLFQTEKDNFYYSGDTNVISEGIIETLGNGTLNRLYQDTCSSEESVHLSINKLKELVKPEIRNKVYCMHLDKDLKASELKKLGFNIAE